MLVMSVVYAHMHHRSRAHADYIIEEGETMVGWAEYGVVGVSHRVGLPWFEFGLRSVD
jgi:hypothetical protein